MLHVSKRCAAHLARLQLNVGRNGKHLLRVRARRVHSPGDSSSDVDVPVHVTLPVVGSVCPILTHPPREQLPGWQLAVPIGGSRRHKTGDLNLHAPQIAGR